MVVKSQKREKGDRELYMLELKKKKKGEEANIWKNSEEGKKEIK